MTKRNFSEWVSKLLPKSARWTLLYVPAFVLGLLVLLRAFGKMPDVIAAVFDAGAKSVPVMIAIALTYWVSTGLGWNLPNSDRASYQQILIGKEKGDKLGAFCILAGELVGIGFLLVMFLLGLTWLAQ